MSTEGEFELIARLAPFLATGGDDLVVGSGDDAAVLDLDGRGVCLAVDVLVDEVHFRRDLSSLADVGWKAVAVNCSDIAAMGATPTVAVVGLCRPASVSGEEIEELYRGMSEACERWGLRLVGGDTVSSQALALSVTVMGDVEPAKAVRRSGARAGDRLVVVGALGAAAAALAGFRAGLDVSDELLAAHRRPIAHVEAGTALANAGATAMIDVSDGFGADLLHICEASEVGALVDAASLPAGVGVAAVAVQLGRDPLEFVAGGGDDYALLAAVPPDAADQIAAALGGAVVGEVTEGGVATLRMGDGTTRDLAGMGWDHYADAGEQA
jgi:thiamine-monophosphate kinase